MTDRMDLQRFRDWLAGEHTKAVRADQASSLPPELHVNPHQAIAAGLAIALHGLDSMLATDPTAGPTVTEAAADDRAHWADKCAGDQS